MPSPTPAVELETVDCVFCGSALASPVLENCPDRLHGTPGLYSVVRCEGCGLLRTSPRPTLATIHRHYPVEYAPFTVATAKRNGVAVKARKLVQRPFESRYGPADLVIPPWEGSGRRLLDVGGGTGAYAYQMSGAGWDTWVLEPSDIAARAAADVLGAEKVTRASLETAEYPDGFFDLVTMHHVLEHLHDPAAGLTKVRRWIRPGGQVRIALPNVNSVERKLFGSSWLGFDLPRHLVHFSPETLAALLENCGYSVESNTPQWIPSMFAQSMALAVNRLRRRHGRARLPYYAAYPVGAVLAGAGVSGAMTVTASRSHKD